MLYLVVNKYFFLGASLAIESKWALGLVFKSLLNSLIAGIDKETLLLIIESGIVPFTVNLACQGTGFNKQWLLRDLEVNKFLVILL